MWVNAVYQDTLRNIVMGEIITEVNIDVVLRCIQEGTNAYATFIQD